MQSHPGRARTVSAVILAAFVVVAVLLVGVGGLLMRHYDRQLTRANLLPADGRAGGNGRDGHAAVAGPLNFLLLGSDARVDNPGMGQRADTIIIVHVPQTMDRAYLISIPRDLLVDIPAYPPAQFFGARAKINSALQYGHGGRGGVQLLAATLVRLTGIRFNGAAVIDFSGLRSAVGVLGGLRMCVDVRIVSIHTKAVFEPG